MYNFRITATLNTVLDQLVERITVKLYVVGSFVIIRRQVNFWRQLIAL